MSNLYVIPSDPTPINQLVTKWFKRGYELEYRKGHLALVPLRGPYASTTLPTPRKATQRNTHE